jgi:hypothetical protein
MQETMAVVVVVVLLLVLLLVELEQQIRDLLAVLLHLIQVAVVVELAR